MSKIGRAGFSIIELLTVIAIIGILAALIFPVMGSARKKARETQCITNMQEIHRALKLFKNDNGRYPAVLLGFAENGVPVDSIKNGTLFSREYVSTAKVFSCPDNRFTDPAAIIPDPLAGQSLIGLDRPAGARLYSYDSYDAQILAYAGNSPQPRYTLSWANTAADVPLNDPNAKEEAFERQLKFRSPPDNTVVTWCSYHRGGDQRPRSGAYDLVLFLDGHVDRIPSDQLMPDGAPWNYPYTVKPKL